MAEFISITLQGEVRGRQICSIPLNINTQARVSQLRELITEGLHIKGTLYHQDKNINLKMCTLAELQIGNGALLKIKSYQKMKDTPMQEIPLCILPHREWCTVQVPARVTVRLLKFIIECEQRIPISDQALTRDNQRWVQDTNSLHQCTEEELQRLQVEDTSKSIKTPQNDMPTITINADCDFQNGSPKIESDYKTFPSAERDFSSGTESGDSDPNLSKHEHALMHQIIMCIITCTLQLLLNLVASLKTIMKLLRRAQVVLQNKEQVWRNPGSKQVLSISIFAKVHHLE